RESPKRFFRFCGTGAAAILAVFLVFWMWNGPPASPGTAARSFLSVLAVAVVLPPIVWLIRVGNSE
ncbi:MAG: hypothetical protein P8181_15120, partial [bacterium]